MKQNERNHVFHHIYEQINNTEKRIWVEIGHINERLRKFEKFSENLNLQVGAHSE